MKTTVRARLAPWLTNGSLLVMALILGGGLYEQVVVDSAWPENLKLIQPGHGGINRAAFWFPIHTTLNLLLPLALWACWPDRPLRSKLLVATGILVAVRVWSFAYFIPNALRFESSEAVSLEQAHLWVELSPVRNVLVLLAVIALWVGSRRALSGASSGQ